jgi:hypothetical protein
MNIAHATISGTRMGQEAFFCSSTCDFEIAAEPLDDGGPGTD